MKYLKDWPEYRICSTVRAIRMTPEILAVTDPYSLKESGVRVTKSISGDVSDIYTVKTLIGSTRVLEGEWLVVDENGGLKTYSDKYFRRKYKPKWPMPDIKL